MKKISFFLILFLLFSALTYVEGLPLPTPRVEVMKRNSKDKKESDKDLQKMKQERNNNQKLRTITQKREEFWGAKFQEAMKKQKELVGDKLKKKDYPLTAVQDLFDQTERFHGKKIAVIVPFLNLDESFYTFLTDCRIDNTSYQMLHTTLPIPSVIDKKIALETCGNLNQGDYICVYGAIRTERLNDKKQTRAPYLFVNGIEKIDIPQELIQVPANRDDLKLNLNPQKKKKNTKKKKKETQKPVAQGMQVHTTQA